jgi:hypothetical protein
MLSSMRALRAATAISTLLVLAGFAVGIAASTVATDANSKSGQLGQSVVNVFTGTAIVDSSALLVARIAFAVAGAIAIIAFLVIGHALRSQSLEFNQIWRTPGTDPNKTPEPRNRKV